MRRLFALAGHVFGLPPRRCRVERSSQWVPTADGTRLATTLYRPLLDAPRSTLLLRTVGSAHAPRPTDALLPQLLAEQGHRVVVQECRGLQSSEGRFEPFLHDGRDGADTLDWLDAQPGAGGPVTLAGFGYAGHAAFSTLAAAHRPVQGLLAGFATRDPHGWVYTGGALELENTFDLALELAAAEAEGLRSRDLARAVRFRPLREADRVASRRIGWLRDWLDHPERDAYWEARTPPLPSHLPQALLIGAWYHPALSAMLADHAALEAAAETAGAPRPRLLVGPWSSAPQARTERARRTWLLRELALAAVAHLEAICGDTARSAAPVRVFVSGGVDWRETAAWPPSAREQVLYLQGDGRSPDGGRLAPEPAEAAEAPDRYLYDPADPVPSEGGASLTSPGATRLRLAEGRGDVLRYLGDPLTSAALLCGSPRVEVFASGDAIRSDFTARLARVDEAGAAFHLTDGIARTRPGGDKPVRVSIGLAPLCHRLRVGERLRLEIGSSSFPRFDLSPSTDAAAAGARAESYAPARQLVHHDAVHPSLVRLHVAD